jgi:DNA-binding CsgD family transcriptional regulator
MLICAIPMALQLFPNVYAPEPTIVYKEVSRTSDSDRLGRFAQYYDLSRREREVLDQVLASRTNVEAAELLYVSESTIKFHIRNLLRKTGCRNRVELRELYTAWK